MAYNKEKTMESIEKHIEKDRKIAEDPLSSPAARRHAKVELEELETYAEHHKEEIAAGDCLLYTSDAADE